MNDNLFTTYQSTYTTHNEKQNAHMIFIHLYT